MGDQQLPDLTVKQFNRWREILEEHTGVQIAIDREAHVKNGVRKRLEELGESSADVYFKKIDSPAGEQEKRLMIDRLLIKDTRFFRHPASYSYLTKVVKQDLLEGKKTINAWSVGCATGEEAYSMAMSIATAYKLCNTKPLFGVVGSDVCHSALARARDGKYRESQLVHVSPLERQSYFSRVSPEQSSVVESIKKRVCFLSSNILAIPKDSFAKNLDIIFCQNVLIYFKQWRRRDVIRSLAQCLKPGGRLILGLGEHSNSPSTLLARDPCREVLAYIRTK